MNRHVLVRYDSDLQRWEIARSMSVGSAAPVDQLAAHGEPMSIARDHDGQVVEILIDAGRLTDAQLAAVREAFGAQVAAAAAEHDPTGDLDLDIIVDHAPALLGGLTVALPAEPGVPQLELTTGSHQRGHLVPAVVDDATSVVRLSEPSVWIRRDGPDLVLHVSGLGVGPDVWVRISISETGALVATGRLHADSTDDLADADPADPPGATGRMAFGLELDLTELYVSITGDPLDPVPPRAERRRQWCDQLLDLAAAKVRSRPAAAITDALAAERVAIALGDESRRNRAIELCASARRWRWIRRVVPGLTALIAAAALAWLLGGNEDEATANTSVESAELVPEPEPEPEPDPEPEVVPDPDPEPEPEPEIQSLETFAGPSQYVFDEFNEIDATLLTASSIAGADSAAVQLELTQTYPGLHYHGPMPRDQWTGDQASFVEAARALCLDMAANGLDSSQFTAGLPPGAPVEVLATAADGSGEPVQLGTYVLVTPVAFTRAVAEECVDRPDVGDPFGFGTNAWKTREPQVLDIVLDSRLAAGRWLIDLRFPDGESGITETPIVIDIQD